MRATQPTPSPSSEVDLSRWLSAVLDHRAGEVDSSLLGVAAMSTDALRALWVDVQVLLRIVDLQPGERRGTRGEPNQGLRYVPLGDGQPGTTTADFSRALRQRFENQAARRSFEAMGEQVTRRGRTSVCRRATMLHTDVALLAPEVAAAAGGKASTSAPLKMYVGDGSSLGAETLSLHWDLARLLAGMITPDPRLDAFVRRWYHATLLQAHASETFDSLQLRHGLRLFPDDAQLLFAAGCEREAFASPIFQQFARQIEGMRMRPDFGPADGELRRAEDYFRRVVDAQPTFTEAAVHLGRVLGLRGQHAEAARVLAAAGDAGGDSTVTYYAALFLGAELEALQRPADAQAAYERAAQAVPAARLPHLALAHLARQSGERADTLDRLRRALAPVSDDPADEPWFVYRRSHARGFEAARADARRLSAEAP
jgi:tetratricopeptide (TPR) repeat protein